MNLPRLVLIAMMLVLPLSGCLKPVPIPPEKSAYVGEWQQKSMYLQITQEGEVHYWRSEDGVTSKINAPLKRFNGNDFEVGMGWFSTTFIVSKPPYQEDGQWKMVVDGVKLTRAAL